MRILLVEDEKRLSSFLRRALREDGYAVDLCHDGVNGCHLALSENYDAILLDLQLPGQDGISILRELRKNKKRTPVIVLTARDTVKDRVLGLDAGADDYLVKPFALDELRARVRAIFRRGTGTPSTVLNFSDLSMNLVDRSVHRAGRRITLTHKEFSLLEYLLRNPEAVLSRTSIGEHVWNYDFDWGSNVVDVFINQLRNKTEGKDESRLIQTVRGVGYVLREESRAKP